MLRSTGFRFFIVGILALLMFIPLFFVSDIVDSRANYSRATIDTVGREWGGAQLFSGPQMVIPVTEEVTTTKRRDVIDPATGQALRDAASGNVIYEHYEETKTETRAPVFLYPDSFTMADTTVNAERHRGIFVVPVYQAEAVMSFDFPANAAVDALEGAEDLHWDKAEIRLFLSSNRALRGRASLRAGDAELALEPLPANNDGQTGIVAATGDPRDLGELRLELGLNGAQSLSMTPVGRMSRVVINSDWPHPSFFGAFLPDNSDITDAGFTATWTIPHLARALPQVSRENYSARTGAAFGVRFFQPNDFYQKAYRAARYGILFIALTFLTVLLLDRVGTKPTHPVQYILIGLAQSIFVILMVAYAEQIGFGAAYALASGATVALLVMFGWTALKMGRRTSVLAVMLLVLYGVLYLILQSADYALLAGATLAFIALALTMYLTRNEDWYGPERDRQPRRGWFGRARPAAETADPNGPPLE